MTTSRLVVVSYRPRSRTRGSSRRDEFEVDSGLDRNGGSLEAVGTLEGNGELGGQDALTMWNKGNGGRANRDGAHWILRLVEPSNYRPGVCGRNDAPNMTAEMGLSPHRGNVDTGAETKAEGWVKESQMVDWRFEPGGRRRRLKSRGGGSGKGGRLLVRRRGEEARGLKREGQAAGGEAESEALRSNK